MIRKKNRPFQIPIKSLGLPPSMDLVTQEQQLLVKALTRFRWNQSRAARELGITRSALRYRLQKYGIDSSLE